ncbi:MAG: Nif11-like leader peptide family natural product precursor [Synergistaceae bacterium]|nr:Nif11-like leader peptide family natural product precursor [Synergistaceae bacterium]
MTDNVKKFLEAVSQDEALKDAMKSAKGFDAIVKLAASRGFAITAEDLAPSETSELSEDEMAAVSGGTGFFAAKVTSSCRCQNYGSGLTWELSCDCSGSGTGINTNNGHERCWCSSEGLGLA